MSCFCAAGPARPPGGEGLPRRAAAATNAVVHMASLPLEANVQFMTVVAAKTLFVGCG